LPAVETTLRSIIAGLFGLVIGSFLTVVVARVPKRESIVGGRSRCPSCGATIRARDNIPVLSYLMLRGRCRACGARISLRYPALEIATGGLFAAVAVVYHSTYLLVLLAAFVGVMLAVAAIDLELKIIPNRITYPALPVFAAAIVAGRLVDEPLDPVRALIGAAAYGGGFFVIAFIVPRGLGMGDVKLTALIGMVCGALGLRFVGVAAGMAILAGGIGGIVALLAGRGRKSSIPFGPYLAAGAVVSVLWGERIADWYLRSAL
jgi:leader peptidase (prepilin peptidase) / N-methyltransferase